MSETYYIRLAEFYFGNAIRDNSREEKIAIGRGIEDGSIIED